MTRHLIVKNLLIATGFIYLTTTAIAGAPFLSGGAEPTTYKQVQLYFYSAYAKASTGTGVQLPGFEVDWGFAPNWSTSLVIPVVGNIPNDNEARTFGLGDIQAGLTYRFIEETETRPQIAIAPSATFTTANASRSLSSGYNVFQIPLWIQKSWGEWTAYTGGGYLINTAPETDNLLYGGLVVQRQITKKLALGAEIYSVGAESADEEASTLLNIGGLYNLTDEVVLLASVGHSILGDDETIAYVGLNWNINL